MTQAELIAAFHAREPELPPDDGSVEPTPASEERMRALWQMPDEVIAGYLLSKNSKHVVLVLLEHFYDHNPVTGNFTSADARRVATLIEIACGDLVTMPTLTREKAAADRRDGLMSAEQYERFLKEPYGDYYVAP